MAIPRSRELTREPIIYHINDPDFKTGSKNSRTESYDKCKWLWGHLLTNKGNRTNKKFAFMMDPNGKICHIITQAEFRRFFSDKYQHKYITHISDDVVEQYCQNIMHMDGNQINKLHEKIHDWVVDNTNCEGQ